MSILKALKDLRDELECPVCYTYIAPPVRQCSNFHSICESCFCRVDKCPVCRQAKIPTRNHVLEMLYMILDIPCQYRDEGCDYIERGKLIKTHEAICVYRSLPCPMSVLLGCTWAGPENKTEEHFRNSHSNIIFGMEAFLIATNFRGVTASVKYLTVFYVYKKMFRVYWDVHANTGEVRFSVTLHGTPEDDERYSYRIRFIRRKTSRLARSLFGKCKYVANEKHLIVAGSSVGTNFDHVKDFCNREGDLQFYVRIVDTLTNTQAQGPLQQVVGSKE